MSLFKEFKDFTLRGNVIDMAVGIIIGVAFGKVVTSLVNDILMPPLGLLIGGLDFSALMVPLTDIIGADQPAIKYGLFLNTVIDLLIVAIIIFPLIKVLNRYKKAQIPQAKMCTECCMSIPKDARRCCHCSASIS